MNFIPKDTTEPVKHIFIDEDNWKILKGYKIEVKYNYKGIFRTKVKGLKLTIPLINEFTAATIFRKLKRISR